MSRIFGGYNDILGEHHVLGSIGIIFGLRFLPQLTGAGSRVVGRIGLFSVHVWGENIGCRGI